ncbi:SAL1 phosphatase [Apostasia shenzhenica]|uniref:SAL1 phosphatase n=1 Tax=Apostasia shenzhenica TaxID=1088818 RepID=A0A2I0ANM3_9ASPA|nr:SAL1 phosphatase [Apostasia shenzhenica]
MARAVGSPRLVAVAAPSINPSDSRARFLLPFISFLRSEAPGLLRRRVTSLTLLSRCSSPYCFDLSPGGLFSRALRGTPSAAMSSSFSSSYEKELAAAKKAASLAARLCQSVQKSILQSDVQSKADKTPVTIADYDSHLGIYYSAGSQALVSLVLKMELPLDSFSLVAEEDSGDLRNDGAQETLRRITKLVNETLAADGSYNVSPSEADVLDAIDSGKSEGGSHGRHWVLDPIDGTKGFLRGDQYAVALALLEEGKVVLGVLACPNLPLAPISSTYVHSFASEVGCLFSARIGAGTHMQSLDGSIPTMKLGVQAPPVRIDSQVKYGALSRGDGAIYLRFPRKGYREKIWDHAAGFIVVTAYSVWSAEAGGVVTDAAGNDLDFSKGRHLDLDTGIICTNRKLMPLLLEAVQGLPFLDISSFSPISELWIKIMILNLTFDRVRGFALGIFAQFLLPITPLKLTLFQTDIPAQLLLLFAKLSS